MSKDSWLLGMVCFDTVKKRTIEDILQAFLQNEFTTEFGRDQSIGALAERLHGELSSDSVPDFDPPKPDGSVEVWYDGEDENDHSRHRYTIEFHTSEPVDDIAPVMITGPGAWIDHTKQDHDVDAQVNALVDAFEALAEAIDPWVAVLAIVPDGQKIPSDPLPNHGIEKLPFVTVFDSEFVGLLGGRDHVLAAPVYETRSLSTGAVLVRNRDMPIVKHPLDEGPRGSPEKHLFEGLSAEDRNRFIDPFHELAEGDLATDLVLCGTHAPFDWVKMDYTAFPELPDRDDHCHVLCVRRDGQKLWEAHNGEFIRRLVAEDGQPIGDLPKGVPPHQEFISTAIRSVYEEDPPMHMYRMDSLEEPSVYASIQDMDTIPEGESIWVDRETPVTR